MFIKIPKKNIDGWQHVKTSHKENAQCSGNTKNCFKTNWRLSDCYVYFCHFGRLHSNFGKSH